MSSSLLFTPQLLVKLVRNMEAFLGVHRVFTSAWKRSMFIYLNLFVSITLLMGFNYIITVSQGVTLARFLKFFKQFWLVACFQGENSGSTEELAWEEYSSYCCNRWWAYTGTRRSWLSGESPFFAFFLIIRTNIINRKLMA